MTPARSERQVFAAARRLSRQAVLALGEPLVETTGPPADVAHELCRIADVAIEALSVVGRDDSSAEELAAVAAGAIDLERELRQHIGRRQAQRRTEFDAALLRLRRIESSAELVEQVCEEAARGCGLRRVLLSRVRDGVWSAWRFHDRLATDATPPDWIGATAIALEDLPLEYAVADSGEAVTVADALTDERVHQQLRRLLHAESLVVAPIAPAGRTLGLLHGDRLGEQRHADDDDRDMLWAFAEGVGWIFERVVMLERIEAQRSVVRRAFAASESLMSTSSQEIDLVQLVGRSPMPSANGGGLANAARRAPLDAQLTSRERDVLALLVQGLGNAAIAERLAITLSTVKTHVRSIMRKAGAVNRSEVIARHHGVPA